MKRFGRKRPEIPHHCRRLQVRFWIALLRMNEITKLQWVADKKHWRVVAGHVPVALFGVKLQRKASRIAFRIRGTFLAAYCGEPNKRWRLLTDRVKQLRRRVLGDLFARAHEISVRARALRVHYALRNAFPVEMRHFFKQQVIFKNDWTARSYCQRILVVAHRTPRVRCHCVFLFFCHLSSRLSNSSARTSNLCATPTMLVLVEPLFQYLVQIQ